MGYNQIRKTETPEGHQARFFRKLNSGARKRKHAPERKSVNNVNNNCFSSSLSDQSDSDVSDDTCSNFDFSDKCNLNRQNGSKFIYMPVEFNSLKVAALVDSGSSINIMSDQLHYSLPHKCKSELNFEAKDSIKLANDQPFQVEGTAHVKMFSQGEKHTILIYILKQTSHPFILGTSYLIQNKISLNVDNMDVSQKVANVRCTKRIA